MAVSIELDTREFEQNIRRLKDHEIGRVMSKALNRTAFEIIDAEKAEVQKTFDFAGGQTRQFLSGSGSFFFDKARPEKLDVTIQPRAKTERILRQHQQGALLSGASGTVLRYRGKLAVPVTARRNTRGRVVREDLPFTPKAGASSIGFKRGSKAFVAGNAILQRQTRKSQQGKRRRKGGPRQRSRAARVLFALVSTAKLKPSFEFYDVARKTALREFPQKAREEFGKMRFRS